MELIQKLRWHCFLKIQNQKASKNHVYLCVREQVIYIFWNFFLFFFSGRILFLVICMWVPTEASSLASSIEGCELLMWVDLGPLQEQRVLPISGPSLQFLSRISFVG